MSEPGGIVSAPAASDPSGLAPKSAGGASEDGSSGEYVETDSIEYLFAMMHLAAPADAVKIFEPSPDIQAVKACVESAGFKYFVDSVADGDPRWSMDPQTFAETWGFGVTAQFLGTYPFKPNETPEVEYLQGLTESESSAYHAAEQNCIAEAGTDFGEAALIDQAVNDFSAAVDADPRVRDAVAVWSECMMQSGYHYPDRDSMIDSFYTEGPDLESQFELEKAVAVVNLSCQPPLQEVYRTVVVERFGEYQTLLQTPRAEPDAVG